MFFLRLMIALVFFDASSHAEMLYVGAGTISHNLGRTSGNSGGGSTFWGTTYPSVFLSGRIQNGAMLIAPTIGYTLFKRELSDQPLIGDRVTSSILTTGLLLAAPGPVEMHGGLGMLFYRVSGSGGSVELPDGPITRTYSIPSRSSSSRTLYLDIGAGAYVSKVRVDLDLLITGVLSDRRAISLVFALNYGVL